MLSNAVAMLTKALTNKENNGGSNVSGGGGGGGGSTCSNGGSGGKKLWKNYNAWAATVGLMATIRMATTTQAQSVHLRRKATRAMLLLT